MVLVHWHNSPRMDMLPHSDILSRFWANQSSLPFLLNAKCLAVEEQISILVFGLTRLGLQSTIYRTWGKHANHYTTDGVLKMKRFSCNLSRIPFICISSGEFIVLKLNLWYMLHQYTIDDFRWGEYKGWSILVFTEIESH